MSRYSSLSGAGESAVERTGGVRTPSFGRRAHVVVALLPRRQVPANHDHPTHRIARELAAQSAFRDRLQGFARHSPVLAPEEYAALLAREGVREMHVRLQVYCHWLADWRAAVDWVSGTLLTAYRARLDPASYRAFLAEYQRRVQAALGDAQPLFYPFKRILVWARRESGPRA